MRRLLLAVLLSCSLAPTAARCAERAVASTDRFSLEPGKVVVVDASSLDVELRAADVRDVEVRTDLRIAGVGVDKAEAWIEAHTPTFTDSPDRLTITATPGKSGFLGLGHLTARAKLRVIVPAGAIPDITTTGGSIRVRGDFPGAEPLRLRTSTGLIEFSGAAAELDVRTASGDVRIDVLRPALRFFCRTSSGTVSLSGGAREVAVDTASGDVWLDNLSGTTTVESSTGKITARWDRLDAQDSVLIRSASGKVHLTLPDTASPRGTITTTGGKIRSDLPGTLSELGDSVRLEGDGPVLEVETASAAIVVARAAD